MKKALTVDLWDTLIYDRPERDVARRDLRLSRMGKILEAACGFDYRQNWGRMLAAYETSWQRMEKTWLTGREIVPAEQVRLYLEILFARKLPKNLPENELLQAYLEPILSHPPLLMPGGKKTLTALRKKGWKLGLISNTGRTSGAYLRRVLQKRRVFDLFDAFSFSDELGVRKPHPAIFEKTMRDLKTGVKDSYHLGDSWEADVSGAQKAGLKPLWFCRNGEVPPDPAVRRIRNWPEMKFLLSN